MATLSFTPNSSEDSDAATWDHIEDATTALKRKTTIDLLTETFARLSIKADLERELQPPSLDDQHAAAGPSSADPLRPSALFAPTIKVTPPSPPGVVEPAVSTAGSGNVQ